MKGAVFVRWTGAVLLCTATAIGYARTEVPKISMEQARAEALKREPGKIKSAELENEKGGSGLRYSFDIETKHGLKEIGVDAMTGKVLEDMGESPKAEARERQLEHSTKKPTS